MELLNLVANNKEINPQMEQLNEETTQILSFVDDSKIEKAELLEQTPKEIVRATVYDRLRNEIVDFLSRFYLIAAGSFLPSQAAGTEIAGGDAFSLLLSNPIIAAKIRNFSAIRANLRIKVIVNKDPFQQGMLLLTYLPDGIKNVSKAQMWKSSLATATGCLRTQLNFMSSDTMELVIPYESTNIMRDLNASTSTHGLFSVRVYSPLVDISSTAKASISVYACMEDVVLDFPTGYNKPTALSDYLTHNDPVKLRAELEELLSKIPSGRVQCVKPDGTCSIDIEDDDKPGGTIQMDMNFKQKAAPNMTICGDENNNHSLYFTKQGLGDVPRVRLIDDENSISKICSVPCFHDSFPIKTTQTAKTIVWQKQVTPFMPQNTSTSGVFNFDYLTFFASLMSLWRGSITYRFRFVKTVYHSLRVRIFFVPGQVDITKCDLDACYSQIVDLATGGEDYVDFKCPYVSPYLWMNTKTVGGSTMQYSGTIGVSLVSELIAPDTVSPSFQTVVERYAEPDILFSVPSALIYSPYLFTSGGKVQMNDDEDADFFSSTNFPSLSLKTVGKAYTTVKELITRPTIFASVSSTAVNNGDWTHEELDANYDTAIVVSPNALMLSTHHTTNVDILSYMASLFSFYRGSVDLKIFTDADKMTVSLDTDSMIGSTNTPFPRSPVFSQKISANDTVYIRNYLTQLVSNNIEGVIELNVPFVAPTIFCSSVLQASLTGKERSNQILPLNNTILIPDKFTYMSLFRSAGNDFSFSYLSGPPVVVINIQ